MDKIGYKLLSTEEHPLKIDNDLIELQNTIIYYGEKILLELDKLSTLKRTLIQQREKDKGKIVITIPEKSKELITEDIVLKHLSKLVIPKGYKGNDQY